MTRATPPVACELVPAASLVEDFRLYPRVAVDNAHVYSLVLALQAGATLPPLIAEAGTRRLVSGYHRRRAYARVYGPEAPVVPVEWRHYASEADLLLDAIAANAAHGLRYARQDEIRCTLLARELAIAPRQLALVLQVPEARLAQLERRTVIVAAQPQPARPTVAHLYAQTVTPAQYEAIRRGPGVPFLQLVRQLYDLVATACYDASRSDVRAALHRLARLIQERVPPPDAEEA